MKKSDAAAADRNDGFLTIEEVCSRLRCGRSKVYSLVHEKRLEMIKFDRASRITERSLRRLEATLLGSGPPSSAA